MVYPFVTWSKTPRCKFYATFINDALLELSNGRICRLQLEELNYLRYIRIIEVMILLFLGMFYFGTQIASRD